MVRTEVDVPAERVRYKRAGGLGGPVVWVVRWSGGLDHRHSLHWQASRPDAGLAHPVEQTLRGQCMNIDR